MKVIENYNLNNLVNKYGFEKVSYTNFDVYKYILNDLHRSITLSSDDRTLRLNQQGVDNELPDVLIDLITDGVVCTGN